MKIIPVPDIFLSFKILMYFSQDSLLSSSYVFSNALTMSTFSFPSFACPACPELVEGSVAEGSGGVREGKNRPFFPDFPLVVTP